MDPSNKILTPTEWSLMESLWLHSKQTGRQAVEYLKNTVGWSRSTTLTMLRRMTEKGYIRCTTENDIKVYSPLIQREDAVLRESKHFLDRVYNGSISTFVSAFTREQTLSKEEIDALYQIIQQAKEESHD